AGGVLMKANITEPSDYVSDIKVTDIYPASKEEAQLSCPGLSKVCPRSLVSKGPYNGFFVVAVMTFSNPDLPVGTDVSFAENRQHWMVIEKNKASRHIRFNPDEYTEDETKLKNMLREWAEKEGIKFG
ncbi:MAG: hypothetical protein J5767_14045, partial [Paludibacteraceae bacterium]|nr:hypothetical protein [Paludibacteraceae bacterium]